MPDVARLRFTWEPRILSMLRIVTGLLYVQHGLNKLFNFPVAPYPHTAYHLFTLNPGVAGLLETIGGALLVVGLFTRPVAFILSGEMAVAYFWLWLPKDFPPFIRGDEITVIYCFLFFYLFFAGGGSWSLDALLYRANSKASLSGRRDDHPSGSRVAR